MRLLVAALALAATTPAVADRVAEPIPSQQQLKPRLRRVPPQLPTPPTEIAALGKQLAGTWACKGVQLAGDGSSRPALLALTVELALDGAWIQTTADETIDGTSVLEYTEYRTYDAISREWTRLEMANPAALVSSTSTGERDGTWTWQGTVRGPGGVIAMRDSEQRTGATELVMWGEQLLAGTWQKLYQFSCTKR